jgi:hypothetical protein
LWFSFGEILRDVLEQVSLYTSRSSPSAVRGRLENGITGKWQHADSNSGCVPLEIQVLAAIPILRRNLVSGPPA